MGGDEQTWGRPSPTTTANALPTKPRRFLKEDKQSARQSVWPWTGDIYLPIACAQTAALAGSVCRGGTTGHKKRRGKDRPQVGYVPYVPGGTRLYGTQSGAGPTPRGVAGEMNWRCVHLRVGPQGGWMMDRPFCGAWGRGAGCGRFWYRVRGRTDEGTRNTEHQHSSSVPPACSSRPAGGPTGSRRHRRCMGMAARFRLCTQHAQYRHESTARLWLSTPRPARVVSSPLHH